MTFSSAFSSEYCELRLSALQKNAQGEGRALANNRLKSGPNPLLTETSRPRNLLPIVGARYHIRSCLSGQIQTSPSPSTPAIRTASASSPRIAPPLTTTSSSTKSKPASFWSAPKSKPSAKAKATLREAYAEPRAGELWLMNAHIPEYRAGGVWNHNPMRPRKLLLHRRELDKLAGRAQQRGLTLVPLKIYFRGNRAKCELALGQGKKFHDKRQSERDQEARREAKEAMARSRKR